MILANRDEISSCFAGILVASWKISFDFILRLHKKCFIPFCQLSHARIPFYQDGIFSCKVFSSFNQAEITIFGISFHYETKLECQFHYSFNTTIIFSNDTFECQFHFFTNYIMLIFIDLNFSLAKWAVISACSKNCPDVQDLGKVDWNFITNSLDHVIYP